MLGISTEKSEDKSQVRSVGAVDFALSPESRSRLIKVPIFLNEQCRRSWRCRQVASVCRSFHAGQYLPCNPSDILRLCGIRFSPPAKLIKANGMLDVHSLDILYGCAILERKGRHMKALQPKLRTEDIQSHTSRSCSLYARFLRWTESCNGNIL
jgi:hypothetical protein